MLQNDPLYGTSSKIFPCLAKSLTKCSAPSQILSTAVTRITWWGWSLVDEEQKVTDVGYPFLTWLLQQ